MDAKMRYAATVNLGETLRRRERSASWLARKVGVSISLMGFVVNNQRTLSHEKALLVSAILNEPIDYLFVATDVRSLAPSVASPEAIPA